MANKREERQDWMQGVSNNVNPDEYLYGRKIDKTFELAKEEKAKAEREARINLVKKDKIKFKADPILELQRKKEQLKHEILTNPVLLKKFRNFLDKHEAKLHDNHEKQNSPSTSHEHPERRSKPEDDRRSKPSRDGDYIRKDRDHHHRTESSSKHRHEKGHSSRRDHSRKDNRDPSNDRDLTKRHNEKDEPHHHERHRGERRHETSRHDNGFEERQR